MYRGHVLEAVKSDEGRKEIVQAQMRMDNVRLKLAHDIADALRHSQIEPWPLAEVVDSESLLCQSSFQDRTARTG
jgi:hypothetical protein